MQFVLAILLILQGFSTRAPRWTPYDHTSPIDDVRFKAVVLKAEHAYGDCPTYPLLVVACRDGIGGIMVALPGAAFSQDNPQTTPVKAQVRLRWDRGEPETEQWTMEPPTMVFPGWQGAPHLKKLESSERLAIEFRLYGLGYVYGEFDLTEKEAALQVARSCK